MGCIIASLIFIAACGASYLITCGLVYLICMCFGFVFSWKIATGIWLLMWLLKEIFNIRKGG